MMKIDHKRDLKEFEEATKLNDAEVADFAAKYTPVIKAHLEHLKNINPQQAEL
jgi:putative membrane protein